MARCAHVSHVTFLLFFFYFFLLSPLRRPRRARLRRAASKTQRRVPSRARMGKRRVSLRAKKASFERRRHTSSCARTKRETKEETEEKEERKRETEDNNNLIRQNAKTNIDFCTLKKR